MAGSGQRDTRVRLRLVVLGVGRLLVVGACGLPWTTGRTDDTESVASLLVDAPWVAGLMAAAVAALGTALALTVAGPQPRLARRFALAAVPLVGQAVLLTPRPVAHVLGATPDGQRFEFDDPARLSWAVLVAAAGVLAAVAAALPAHGSSAVRPP